MRPAADDTSGIVASHSLVPDALVHAFGTFGTLMPPNLPLIGAPTPLRSRAARQPLKLDS